MANEKRLIDANSLVYYCKEIAKHEWNKRTSPVSWSDAYEGFIDDIDGMPTVDAAPVVYAHWEDGCAIHNGKEVYKSIDCSHCNEIFKTEDREYWKKRFKVCPFCGAIMDGERREGS